MRKVLAVLVVVGGGIAFLLFRPVCVQLSAADLAAFTVPIEQRTDRDFYLQVFQQRRGQWFQCKSWISRAFFL